VQLKSLTDIEALSACVIKGYADDRDSQRHLLYLEGTIMADVCPKQPMIISEVMLVPPLFTP
jgi:hypothetical protein